MKEKIVDFYQKHKKLINNLLAFLLILVVVIAAIISTVKDPLNDIKQLINMVNTTQTDEQMGLTNILSEQDFQNAKVKILDLNILSNDKIDDNKIETLDIVLNEDILLTSEDLGGLYYNYIQGDTLNVKVDFKTFSYTKTEIVEVSYTILINAKINNLAIRLYLSKTSNWEIVDNKINEINETILINKLSDENNRKIIRELSFLKAVAVDLSELLNRIADKTNSGLQLLNNGIKFVSLD